MERHFPGLGESLVVTRSEEEAIAATRDAVAQGYDIVVAAGGDGTVDTVACQLLGQRTALGILPLGSVMNVARMLGIPRDLEAAAAIIADGEVRTIDVGEANGPDLFRRRVGRAQRRGLPRGAAGRYDAGRYRALLAALWVLVRYRPPRMILHLDDRVLTTRALAVAVANGPYSGLGFTVAPKRRSTTASSTSSIFSRFSRTELVRHFIVHRLRPPPIHCQDGHLSLLAGTHRGCASAPLPCGWADLGRRRWSTSFGPPPCASSRRAVLHHTRSERRLSLRHSPRAIGAQAYRRLIMHSAWSEG